MDDSKKQKNRRLQFRATDEESRRIDELQEWTGESMTKIVMDAIKMKWELERFRHTDDD